MREEVLMGGIVRSFVPYYFLRSIIFPTKTARHLQKDKEQEGKKDSMMAPCSKNG
jgi:hypothetical protein